MSDSFADVLVTRCTATALSAMADVASGDFELPYNNDPGAMGPGVKAERRVYVSAWLKTRLAGRSERIGYVTAQTAAYSRVA